MARAGSREPFGEAEEDLWFYSRIHVSRRDIERIAEQVGQQMECWQVRQPPAPPPTVPTLYVSFDGTAAPMRRAELKGRKGKQADGSAKGREVKVGCVFTQTCLNEEGFPVRDEDSTTYVGGIESSTILVIVSTKEALGARFSTGRRVIVLTDGAAYNKTIGQMHFPSAQHIIDLYHAREHLHCLPTWCSHRPCGPQLDRWRHLLDQGAIETPHQRSPAPSAPRGQRRRDALKKCATSGKTRPSCAMLSSATRACSSARGYRGRLPNRCWPPSRTSRHVLVIGGAHAILQIRCCMLSRRFDTFGRHDLPLNLLLCRAPTIGCRVVFKVWIFCAIKVGILTWGGWRTAGEARRRIWEERRGLSDGRRDDGKERPWTGEGFPAGGDDFRWGYDRRGRSEWESACSRRRATKGNEVQGAGLNGVGSPLRPKPRGCAL